MPPGRDAAPPRPRPVTLNLVELLRAEGDDEEALRTFCMCVLFLPRLIVKLQC